MSNNKKTFVYQGAILAFTSIIVRIIGFFYRIPMIHIIGEEGMGYYSSAFQVYAFLLMISSFGVPNAMSKLISNELALRRENNIKIIFRAVLSLSLITGLILSLLMYFCAGQISLFATGGKGIELALKSLAPALFILSILSVFRGYFQGFKTMIPTALSQLVEQVFNAGFSILLVYLLFEKGLEYGAAGGTMGTGIGAFFALLVLIGIFIISESGKKRKITEAGMTYKEVFKLMLLTLLPMIFSASIYNLPNIVDMIFFQRALAYKGIAKEAYTSLYGLFSTKYLLLIAVPISFASVFSVSSLPSITASFARGKLNAVRAKSNLAIKISLLIAIPSVAGLIVLAQPIIYLLFGETNLEYSANILMLGATSIITFVLSSISMSILQSLDEVIKPVYNAIIAMVVKIIALIAFVLLLDLSLYGVLISMYLFGLVCTILNFKVIRRHIRLRYNYVNGLLKPIFASIVMSIIGGGAYYLVGTLTKHNTIAVIFAIILSILTYFFTLIKIKTLNKNELATLGRLGKFAMRFM